MAELLIVVVAGAAAGYLAWYLAGLFFPDRPGFTLLYACGALGVFLSAFLLAATLLVGFISRWTEDEDREWWARGGAWMLIIGATTVAAGRTVARAASAPDAWIFYPISPPPGGRWVSVVWVVLGLIGTGVQLVITSKKK